MFIPNRIFKIAKCAAREMTRFAINCIRVEREADGRARATVTDGHRLLTIAWKDGEQKGMPWNGEMTPKTGFAANLPLSVATKIGNAISEPIGKGVVIDENKEGLSVLIANDNAKGKLDVYIDTGAFPPWRDVVEKYTRYSTQDDKCDQAVVIGVNPRLLGETLLAMADALGVTRDSAVKGCRLIVPVVPNKPIQARMDIPDEAEAIAVVMPCHIDNLNI